jgi:hypothetical protein
MTDRAKRARVPEFFSTSIRKVEPVGGDVVRLYFALERQGTWDDQFTVLMPCASVPAALGFAVASAREISAEIVAPEGSRVEVLQ